jgi:hypothetical protein
MAGQALVYRHNRVTRFTHWINAITLTILLMSGLMIFNAHPHLYWGNISEPAKAFLSVGAQTNDRSSRGYVEIFGKQINTTGFLGVQQTSGGGRPSARFQAGLRCRVTFPSPARAAGISFSLGFSPLTACFMWPTTSPSAICENFF